MNIKKLLYRNNRQALTWIGRCIFILSAILFIFCIFGFYEYTLLLLPLLIGTYCILKAENNTKDVIGKVMFIVAIILMVSFQFLDHYNFSSSILANYQITKGRVDIIARATTFGGKNRRGVAHYSFQDANGQHIIGSQHQTIYSKFEDMETVFVLYQKDKPSNSEIYKNQQEVYERIHSYPYIISFWKSKYWLIQLAFLLTIFIVIPIMLTCFRVIGNFMARE